MALVQAPDVFGYTIFCDDIRQENTGKLLFIGVYGGQLIVHGQFPVTLPKFAFAITLLQRRSAFRSTIGLRIYLPGEPENAPSFQSDLEEAVEGAALAQVDALAGVLETTGDRSDDERIAMQANIVLAPLVVKAPGSIRVRAVIGDDIVRLGSLRVLAAEERPSES